MSLLVGDGAYKWRNNKIKKLKTKGAYTRGGYIRLFTVCELTQQHTCIKMLIDINRIPSKSRTLKPPCRKHKVFFI